jgi:thiol-disulfide isomerase/thioredoxin
VTKTFHHDVTKQFTPTSSNKNNPKNMNIKKQLCILIMCFAVMLHAQSQGTGIKWTTGLTWQQVKAKAKKENKYIFVDCYATWCKPCKEMDVKVYTVDSVGEFLNKEFISVKVQMDQTKNDNAEVRSWYKTASDISNRYSSHQGSRLQRCSHIYKCCERCKRSIQTILRVVEELQKRKIE